MAGNVKATSATRPSSNTEVTMPGHFDVEKFLPHFYV
jgi:hypothetical protein